jgi:hypothetical protein
MDYETAMRPTPRQRFQAMLEAYQQGQSLPSRSGRTAGSPEDEDAYRGPTIPYPGLRSFSPKEGGVFFGRERSVNDIRDRLAKMHVAVVLGASGSGKSSVVRAGLMPRLNSTKGIRGRPGNWYAAEFRPRLQPMRQMIGALADLVSVEFSRYGSEPSLSGPPDPTSALQALHAAYAADPGLQPASQEHQRETRAGALCQALFSFVDSELDRLDRNATRGLRAGRPNLLLVVDQFEEVFRPEVMRDPASGGGEFLDLLLSAFGRLEKERELKADARSGLFIVITMRSEELHRCTEYPSLRTTFGDDTARRSLADMVNSSAYLLDLLDPEQDRQDLREAIIRPARQIFADWGLPLQPDNPDSPFAEGVPDWLLEGAQRLTLELEHRPDELPLLQHALQTIWHNALNDWMQSGENQNFVIRRGNLPGRPMAELGIAEDAPDLAAVLDRQADLTASKAAARLESALAGQSSSSSSSSSSSKKAEAGSEITGSRGVAAIRAAFRSLAQHDDRGNWARRIADIHQITAFTLADPLTNAVPPTAMHEALGAALNVFVSRGYLCVKEGQYDISHEALIRNWKQYQDWLRQPHEVSQTLARTVTDLDPALLEGESEEVEQQLVFNFPATVRERLSAVLKSPTLPEEWALDQIVPLLKRPTIVMRWSYVKPSFSRAGSDDDRQFGKAILQQIRKFVDRSANVLIRADEKRHRIQSQQRKLKAWALGGIGVAIFGILVATGIYFIQDYAATKRAAVNQLITFAQRDPSPGFRLRILLLLEALRQSEGIEGIFIQPSRAEDALRETLARSPSFGGMYKAVGLKSDGGTLALLDKDRLTVHDLSGKQADITIGIAWSNRDSSSSGGGYVSSFFEPDVAGFIRHPEFGEIPAVYHDGIVQIAIDGKGREFNLRKLLPPEFGSATFRLVELTGSVRFTINTPRFDGGPPRFETRVFELGIASEGEDLQFKPITQNSLVHSGLRFAPTIAAGCGLYAYLESSPVQPTQKLVAGALGTNDEPARIDLGTPLVRDEVPGNNFIQAIGFSSDCGGIAVRTAPGVVASIPIQRDDSGMHFGQMLPSTNLTSEGIDFAKGIVFPLFPRNRPLLAAARMEQNQTRFAWLIPGGIAVVGSGSAVQDAWTSKLPLLTGLENAVRLQFSDGGRTLTAVQQSWGSGFLANVRSWNLDPDRLQVLLPLTRKELVEQACRVARWEAGDAKFTSDEERAYGSGRQPCEGH